MAELYMSATLTQHFLPQRLADFPTITDALDYAALGETGVNFYDGRCRLTAVVQYAALRRKALDMAKRLCGLGLKKGSRVALVADTNSAFMEVFYGCLYAGLLPVPLPVPSSLGTHDSYVKKLSNFFKSCDAHAVFAPAELVPFAKEAAKCFDMGFIGSAKELQAGPAPDILLASVQPDDVAYLQYTSGSTRFPRGVTITHRAAMANLQGMLRDGLGIGPTDRCVSWLPFYHDMGLVGFVLAPMASQMSVDYLRTQDFAMRPRQWLNLISQNKGTVSFAPPFGYDICSRRLREGEAARFDLSSWRVAGIGAEPIRDEILERFARQFSVSGFDQKSFVPCYGLAESTLGVCFSRRDIGIQVDRINRWELERTSQALPFDGIDSNAAAVFVNCGSVLPGHELEIRNDSGRVLPERQIGRIMLKGPSLMSGYFQDEDSTQAVLDKAEGWLDTGDLGYLNNGELFITGRRKDLLIVRGRNIWPQDIEYLAESQPEIRPGDVIAFLVPNDTDPEVVVQVQCRITDQEQRERLVQSLTRLINGEFGLTSRVELVPPHSLPRTSSGKPSRAEARKRFLQTQSGCELTLAVG
ncbi:fatty acyl-AMP ligase [Azomonas macrocytogenes]|uniref:Fatty-acyl-CoA synthase n=1 Tax=Azomonas macrocytogenes TaxID=69962 RepID=A0A839SXE7_AZOMA|nr:fatty acyl-AMP ligase [Azomonas macrocytogenes]MBB3102031.1 fatty-acyl-CoA synthase [Azomonas macrocytogenes]